MVGSLALVLTLTLAAPLTAAPSSSAPSIASGIKSNLAASKRRAKSTPLLGLGMMQLEQGNAKEAVVTLRKALDFYSGEAAEPAALLQLGRAFAELRERTLAESAYNLLLKKFPVDPLADDAQYGLAIIDARHLLATDRLREVFDDFVFQDPLSLDFDGLIYLVGFSDGYRLDGIDRALQAFRKTWKQYPASSRAADAIAHEAINRAFLLGRQDEGRKLFALLRQQYNASPHVPLSLLAEAFLDAAVKNNKHALELLDQIEPQAKLAPTAAFLAAYLTAYYQHNPRKALIYLTSMGRLAKDDLWRAAATYHQAMIHFVHTHDFRAAQNEAEEARSLADGIDGGRAKVIRAAADYLAQTARAINEEKDVKKARLRYALYFQGAGHSVRAEEELREILGTATTPEMVSRLQFELGVTLHDDLLAPSEAAELLEACLSTDTLSEDRKAEAAFRLASLPAKSGDRSSHLANLARRSGTWASSAARELARQGRVDENLNRAVFSRDLKGRGISDPSRAPVLRTLAEMFEKEGNYLQALECYGRLLTIWPPATEAMERVERRLALEKLEQTLGDGKGGQKDDGPLLFAIARLLQEFKENKKATKYLRRAARAAKGTADADRIGLALLKAKLKDARSNAHGVTLAEDFLQDNPGRTAEALEALAIKADLLEKQIPTLSDDPEEQTRVADEAAGIRRYLIKRGVNVAESALVLAKSSVAKEEFVEALAVVERGTSVKPAPATLLELKAEILDKLKREEQKKDVLHTLVTVHPESVEGKRAAKQLQKMRLSALNRTLSNIKKPSIIQHRLAFFLADAPPEDMKAAKGLLEHIVRAFEKAKVLNSRTAVLLGRALIAGGAKINGGGLLRKAAAMEGQELKKIALKLEAAKAYAEGADASTAYTILEEIKDRSTEAKYLMAKLQLEKFRDPEQARPILISIIRNPSARDEILAKAYLMAESLITGQAEDEVLKEKIRLLRQASKQLPLEFRFEVLEKCAQLEERNKEQSAAANTWLAAAEAASTPEKSAHCSGRAVSAMIKSKQWSRAKGELNRLLAAGVAVEHREQLRSLLRQTAAKQQIATLRRSMNWDDPESEKNLEIFLKQARLYMGPLGDFRTTESVLNQAAQLFPGTRRRFEINLLRKKLPLLRKLKKMSNEAKEPAAVFELARMYEEQAREPERAAHYYRMLIEKWKTSAYVVPALMYLIRLESLVLDEGEEAKKHLDRLVGHPAAERMAPRLISFINLRAAQDKLGRLYTRAKFGKATVGELVELGEAACLEMSDPATISLVIERLRKKRANRDAYRLALLAASSLKPQGLLTPGGTDSTSFLESALKLASTGQQKARVHLLLGTHLASIKAPREAHTHFQRAIEAAPRSAEGEEALFRMAEVLETMLDETDSALTSYERLAKGGTNQHLVQVASTRAERLTQRLAVQGLMNSTHNDAVSKKSPVLYFYSGRRLQKEHKDLETALAAFRAYIRLGNKPPLIIKSYSSAAEILVRLERPKEALDELDKLMSAYPEMVDREEVMLRMAEIREVNLADYDGAARLYKQVARSRTPRAKAGQDGVTRITKLRRELKQAQRVGLAAEAASQDVLEIRTEFLRGRRKNWRGAADALRDKLEEATKAEARAPLLLELGSILDNQLKDYREALEVYDEFLTVSKNKRHRGDVMLRKGDIQTTQLNLHQEAFETFEVWLETFFGHPRRVEVMLKSAELKETKLDRVQEALDGYRVIADSYPRSGYDEKALMRIAYLQRTYFADFNAAQDAYRQIIERFPFGEWADDSQYYIARIFEIELGDLTQAKTEYEKLLSTYPTSPFVGPARDALIRIERR